MPNNFDPEFRNKWLKGSSILDVVNVREESLLQEYGAICSHIKSNICDTMTFEDFKWGRDAVSTRVFRVTIHGHNTIAMVVMGDMLNHGSQPDFSWSFNDIADGFVMRARRPIIKGQAITDSYGRKSNVHFLALYGFALPDNKADECALRIPGTHGYPRRIMSTASSDDSGFRQALALCRDTNPSPVAIEDQTGEDKIAAELKALACLKLAATKAIDEFDETVEEDIVLLGRTGKEALALNERNCVLTRLGEKRVAQTIIHFVDSASFIFQDFATEQDLEERLQKDPEFTQNNLQYLAQIRHEVYPEETFGSNGGDKPSE